MKTDAVILEVRGGKAVALAAGGSFVCVKDQGYRPGQRVTLSSGQAKGAAVVARRTLLIAACLVCLFASSALAAAKYIPWTYVSMDAETLSVQYQLNARGEVLNAVLQTAENDETVESALESQRFEPVESAAQRFLAAAEKQSAQEIVIEVSSRTGKTEKTAEKLFAQAENETEAAVRVKRVDWKETQKTRKDSRPTEQPKSEQKEARSAETQGIGTDVPARRAEQALPQEEEPEFTEPRALQTDPEMPQTAEELPEEAREESIPRTQPQTERQPGTEAERQDTHEDPVPEVKQLENEMPQPAEREEGHSKPQEPLTPESEERRTPAEETSNRFEQPGPASLSEPVPSQPQDGQNFGFPGNGPGAEPMTAPQ